MRFHCALELDRHRSSPAVQRAPGRDPNPAFTDAVLLDIDTFTTIEAHANRARQHRFVIVWATWINAEAVRQGVGHGVLPVTGEGFMIAEAL